MRMRRKLPEEVLEFQIAPMVDVFLCLLLFFIMVTSVSALRSDKEVVLPVAANSAKKNTARSEAVLNIHWSATKQSPIVKLEGVVYDNPSAIVPILEARVKVDSSYRVVIRAERDAPASAVSRVLAVCAEAGVDNITFAVLNRE